MKKRLLVLIVAALLCLTACDEQPAPTAPTFTAPTLPDFDETLTPDQHLTAALDQLQALDSFTVSYGSGWKDSLSMNTGSGKDAFTALRQLVPNETLISDFCAMGMMVSPSNDGSFLYQSSVLTPQEVCQLVCDRDMTAEELDAVASHSDVTGTVRIGVDADRIFQSLQVDILLSDTVWTLQIIIQR